MMSMYFNERWNRVERAGRVTLTQRAAEAFAAYHAAFVALVDAELDFEHSHCPPSGWYDEHQRLCAARLFDEAEDMEHAERRRKERRRSETLSALCEARAAVARARARFEAETKHHPNHWRWYVSARHGEQAAILLGPFESPEAAADAVPLGTQIALDNYPGETSFAAFGICAGDPRELGDGTLNKFAAEGTHATDR